MAGRVERNTHTSCLVEEGAAAGIATSGGVVRAAVTIDAGGGRHWMARQLGIEVRRRSPRLIARYGYVVGSCPPLDEAPVFRTEPRGWTWMSRVGAGRYHWSRVGPDTRAAGERPDLLASLPAEGPSRAEDVTWRCAERLAGPGFFLVGDAAAVVDPASSHGVLRAVMSGIQAASLAVAISRSQVPPAPAFEHYDTWLRTLFEHDISMLTSAR
jgi:flavin-dependent dehydrogenase